MTARDGDDRDRADWGADPELLDVLRGADPAHSLPPLSPADLARLVQATIDSGASVTHLDERRRRRVLVPAVAAAALVLVAGTAVSLLGRDDPGSAPVATSPPATSDTPTVLSVPVAGNGRCAVPTAEMLAAQEQAFEGTVTTLEGGTATLEVTAVYAGEVAEQVEVRAPSQDLGALLSAVQFETGRSYLVSASSGQVTLCGYTAEDTPALETLYQQAFAG